MSLIEKMQTSQVTPLELVEEFLAIYERRDYLAMGELFEAYCFYSGATARAKETAKSDLDTIAHIADETLVRGNPELAAMAIRKGYAKTLGPVRGFYRISVVYEPVQ